MLIPVSELTKKLSVTVKGDENWLTGIYESFPAPAGETAPVIEAVIDVGPVTHGRVPVSGSLAYEPFVSCSRCDMPIRWPIQRNFQLEFREQEAAATPGMEKDLSKEELDFYFIQDGDVDLELVLNDLIQTAVPSQTVLRDEKDDCRQCGLNIGKPLVFGSESKGKENPFSVLKNLKLSD